MSTRSTGEQAVELEIIRSAFFATVRQAGRIILRSSFSPIIRDAFDFCVTLIGPPPGVDERLDLDVVAMNESLAHFSGVMPFMVRNLVWEYGVDNLRPGDMIAVNNPFKGGNHVYDNGFFTPVFVGDRMIGGVAVKAHLMDMGGVTAGGYSTRKRSLFEEGVVISGVPVFRDDEPYTPGFNLYFDNSRLPDNMLADLQALHSAATFAEQRLVALAETHGVDTLHDAMAYTLDYADRSMRDGLRALPDGDFVGEDGIDADAFHDEPYVVRATVHKRGDEVEVDLSGSTREAASSVNCSVFDAANGVYTALKFLCDPHNPNNAGAFRAITLVAPEGTFVTARPPAATTMYFDAAEAVFNAVTKAILSGSPAEAGFGGHYGTNMGLLMTGSTGAERAGPRGAAAGGYSERLAAATQSVPVVLDEDDGSGRKLFVAPMLALGGFGASSDGDGESFVSMSQQNIMDMSVESIEEDHPVVVLRKEFVADTGGPGEYRGGVGVVYDRMLAGDADVYPMLLHLRILPWGAGGSGGAGRPGGAWIGEPDGHGPGGDGRGSAGRTGTGRHRTGRHGTGRDRAGRHGTGRHRTGRHGTGRGRAGRLRGGSLARRRTGAASPGRVVRRVRERRPTGRRRLGVRPGRRRRRARDAVPGPHAGSGWLGDGVRARSGRGAARRPRRLRHGRGCPRRLRRRGHRRPAHRTGVPGRRRGGYRRSSPERIMTMLFGRPDRPELSVTRTDLDETCPECGSGSVQGYPALEVTGWALVARCADCLHVLRREPSPTPFGFSYVPYSAHLKDL